MMTNSRGTSASRSTRLVDQRLRHAGIFGLTFDHVALSAERLKEWMASDQVFPSGPFDSAHAASFPLTPRGCAARLQPVSNSRV
jgi:hypothetical protein